MNEFTIHPNVYSTGRSNGLLSLLEQIWVKKLAPGKGSIFIIAGFANYNGGVRFYETFRQHTEKGGKILTMFSGSASRRLTSKQVVEELLKCNARVFVINRKHLLHAKCYGMANNGDEFLIVSSGNFTGPGMTQNIEASILVNSCEPSSFSTTIRPHTSDVGSR